MSIGDNRSYRDILFSKSTSYLDLYIVTTKISAVVLTNSRTNRYQRH